MRLIGGENIFIGDSVCIQRLSNLSAWGSFNGEVFHPVIIIGEKSLIGEYANISCVNKIILGKNVLLGRWVTIIDHAHGCFTEEHLAYPPINRPLYSKGNIVIDDDVWIADKVTICSNVHIHKGAVIGANSVVTKDVPPYTLVAGCPAKIIKTLNLDSQEESKDRGNE